MIMVSLFWATMSVLDLDKTTISSLIMTLTSYIMMFPHTVRRTEVPLLPTLLKAVIAQLNFSDLKSDLGSLVNLKKSDAV